MNNNFIYILHFVCFFLFIELLSFIFDIYYFNYCRPTHLQLRTIFQRLASSHSNTCDFLDTIHYKLRLINVQNILKIQKFYA